MKTQELAKKLGEKEIQNILGFWEKNNDQKKLSDFNCLVRLGDSKALAMATVLNDNRPDSSDEYKAAYEI